MNNCSKEDAVSGLTKQYLKLYYGNN
jgi:hypothetical protein